MFEGLIMEINERLEEMACEDSSWYELKKFVNAKKVKLDIELDEEAITLGQYLYSCKNLIDTVMDLVITNTLIFEENNN